LKFFVHFGAYMTQKLGTFTELVGNDVNLVHRLAKNHIKEKTGFKAYAAFTQSVMDALGLEDFQNSLIPHRETFADVGEVQMYVHDMHQVWERLKDRVRIEVRPEEALVINKFEFPVPPSILWEYLTKAEHRAILLGVEKAELHNKVQGRTAVDSVYYCYHGEEVSARMTILDWRPFEQFTMDCPTPLNVSFYNTLILEPTNDGTRLTNLFSKSRGAWLPSLINNFFSKFVFGPQMGNRAELLRQRIQQDLADGTVFVSPPIEVDKAQVAALATHTLTHDY